MTTTAAGDAAVARLNKATEAFEKIITGASNQVVDVPGYGNQPTLAARVDERLDETTATAAAEANRSRDEADRATTQANAAANSVTLATAEFNKAKTQADRAQSEADRAAQITGLATVSDAVALAALPLPDVWAPLSDSLRLITGYGRDVLVGSDVVARMVNFSRSTTATYIGKDGSLKTAAVNEPRFEKEGLLIEGQSSNLIPWSRGADFSKNPSYFLSGASAVTDGDALIVTATALNGGVGGVLSGTHEGKTTTVSLWAKGAVGGERLRVGLSTDQLAMPFDVVLTTEWVRYSKTYSIGASDTQQTSIRIYAQNPCTFSIDKVQCELLPFASSYIPTNGAAVTRAPDIVTIPWAMNINPATVTVALNYDLAGINKLQRIIEYASAVNPRYLVQMSERGVMDSFAGASAVAVSSAPYGAGSTMVAATSRTRHAFKLSGKPILSATPDGPAQATTVVLIGSGIAGGAPIYGHVRNLRIWHRTLTDDQIKAVA